MRTCFVLLVALALGACASPEGSKEPVPEPTPSEPVTVRLEGAVEKGPFLLGSSVTVTPASTADGQLVAGAQSASGGQVFRTETENDLGEFALNVTYQGPATIEGTGYYYNEATGDLSSSPLTLRAFHQVGDADAEAHVNLITHLTYQRVQRLVEEDGLDGAAAIAQAEGELHDSLGLGAPVGTGTELSLTGGDTDDDAYLFAVSTLFAQAAYNEAISGACGASCSDSKLQELLNTTVAAFATAGAVPEATVERIEAARRSIDNEKVMAALGKRLAQTGSTATVPDLDRVIPWTMREEVAACTAKVIPDVSTECKAALCGDNQRWVDGRMPLDLKELQSRITELDDAGWRQARCVVDTCIQGLDNDRWQGCLAECTEDPSFAAEYWGWMVFYSARDGECD